jgi:hypothetical protein
VTQDGHADGEEGVQRPEDVPTDLQNRLSRDSTVRSPEPQRRSLLRTIATRPLALLLILFMAVGSIVLWIGVPVGWLWVASHATETSAPTLGPYLLVIFAIPITMFVLGKLLTKTNSLYERVTGQEAEVRMQLPWHKSLRDSSDSGRRATVLDVVMIVSVGVALTAFAVWFFFFAGSSLPGAPA